ncbi:MAG: stage 0 sporulation family protein [Oscillospiraceae bacterium]|nr:stage 0 sporulation family protein [Oscillospiraceae bacterium]
MTEIIGVRFKQGGKQYYFDPQGTEVTPGEGVILQTSRGLEYGECSLGNTEVEDEAVVQPLCPMVRIATEEDREVVRRNREKEDKAMEICQQKIKQHGLEMKLVDVEYSFEGNKILFFFTSETRVDFRSLVKDLAGTFRARIELRQIGVRDEAKMLGGLGICGKPFCCSTFLDEFQPVSIKMAKTQSLSLNPTKISGTCGRLMCCLKFEQEAYEDLVKNTPKMESFVETPDGAGTVSGVSLLRQQVKVRLESAPDTQKTYHNCELCVIRNGKGKRPEDYVQPPLEELNKRRYVPEKPLEEERQSGQPRSRLSEALEAVLSASDAGNPPREEKQQSSAPKQQNQGENRRRGGQAQGGRRRGESHQQQGGSAEKQQNPDAQKTDGGEKKSGSANRNHRRRRHHRGGGGSGQQQNATPKE